MKKTAKKLTVLHLLLQLEELLRAAQLLQLFVLVSQTLVLCVDLLALKPHLTMTNKVF